MKFYVARALQISQLGDLDVERLHQTETLRGYVIPNWNLQEILNLPPLKDSLGIPEERELQAAHNDRIEREMKDKGFLRGDEPDQGRLEWLHAVDMNVVTRKNEIVWEYSSMKGLGSRIKDSLKHLAVFLV